LSKSNVEFDKKHVHFDLCCKQYLMQKSNNKKLTNFLIKERFFDNLGVTNNEQFL
jgi:hypothetical protein